MFRFVAVALVALGALVAPVATAQELEPKAAVEAYVAATNAGDIDALARLMAEDVASEGEEPGRDAFKERSADQLASRNEQFAKWSFRIDRIMVDGDNVAARLVLDVTLKNGREMSIECMLMGTVERGEFTWVATSVDAEDSFAVLMLSE